MRAVAWPSQWHAVQRHRGARPGLGHEAAPCHRDRHVADHGGRGPDDRGSCCGGVGRDHDDLDHDRLQLHFLPAQPVLRPLQPPEALEGECSKGLEPRSCSTNLSHECFRHEAVELGIAGVLHGGKFVVRFGGDPAQLCESHEGLQSLSSWLPTCKLVLGESAAESATFRSGSLPLQAPVLCRMLSSSGASDTALALRQLRRTAKLPAPSFAMVFSRFARTGEILSSQLPNDPLHDLGKAWRKMWRRGLGESLPTSVSRYRGSLGRVGCVWGNFKIQNMLSREFVVSHCSTTVAILLSKPPQYTPTAPTPGALKPWAAARRDAAHPKCRPLWGCAQHH